MPFGTLKPPPGRVTKDFNIYLAEAVERRGAGVHYRASTGEFVAGPFAPGGVRLGVMCSQKAGGYVNVECAFRDVKVEPGKVTRVELAPPAELPRRPNSLEGRVFLPGGKDPALVAVVTHFARPGEHGVPGGMTDASGQIRSRVRWQSRYAHSSEPSENPPESVVVALLPGSHGAAIIREPDLRRPLEIVLPPPLTLRGRVTVAGAVPSNQPGQIHVLAAYEGRDRERLAHMLSVQTTAPGDGSFELAGLTPGQYTIQAAVDDIWLSPSVAVDVTERPLDPVTLTIPAPGGPVVVKVVGLDGTPLPGRPVTVDRPPGPLASQLWPAEFKTDGAGEARIPALEAGRHTLRAKGADVSSEVLVPALPVKRPVEVQLRITTDGRQ